MMAKCVCVTDAGITFPLSETDTDTKWMLRVRRNSFLLLSFLRHVTLADIVLMCFLCLTCLPSSLSSVTIAILYSVYLLAYFTSNGQLLARLSVLVKQLWLAAAGGCCLTE